MAINYVVAKGVNPRNRDLEVFRGKVKHVDHLGLQEMAKVISDQCSVTSSDVVGVYHNLFWALERYLLNGYLVRLGSLGSMRLVALGKMVPTAEDWKGDGLKMRVLFTPGGLLDAAYRGAEFRSMGKSESLLVE